MNTSLRNLQEAVRVALRHPEVSPGAINEIIRETIRIESETARDLASKATTVLDLLNDKELPSFLTEPPRRTDKGIIGASFYTDKQDSIDLDLS